MEQNHQKEIEEIIDDLKCPKDRKVSKTELGTPCKAKYIGNETLFECLEDNPKACKFSWFVGHFHLCRSSHEARIAKGLKE